MTAAYFEDHPTDPDKMIMRKPPLEVQEPPKYSFKAHWEKDGRIGVVGAIVRPDGGVHLLQDFIDPPQRTEQNFCSRCGKRTKDLTHIHTCTPPQEGT
jgi:hypothetical protein